MTSAIVVDQRFDSEPEKVVWKWELPLQSDPQSIDVPRGARLIHCEFIDVFGQFGFQVWFEVSLSNRGIRQPRVFQIWGTGDGNIPKSAKHVATGINWNIGHRYERTTPAYVWHLYEFPSGAKVVDV